MYEAIVELANGQKLTFDFDHAPTLGVVMHIGDGRYATVLSVWRKQRVTHTGAGTVLQNRQNWE